MVPEADRNHRPESLVLAKRHSVPGIPIVSESESESAADKNRDDIDLSIENDVSALSPDHKIENRS